MSNSKKSKKTQAKRLETQIENAEKSLDVIDKITEEEMTKIKEIQAKIRAEKKRLKKVEKKAENIKNDLKTQLEIQGKFGKHFDDMVEDYIYFVKLKEDLQNDIKVNGLRIESKTGNGYPTEKDNKSVEHLIKVNAQMLKILQDLDLKSPGEEGEGDDLL
ncbi:MAG: hypothetical protein J6A89_04095 [Clostridia bacterium]|nr:hypothetical protein [Clostridia bacterium]